MATVLEEYPFQPHSMSIDGHTLSYLDEGKGPVVVMVHGNPTWSYLYRNLVSSLRDRYRCIVPDHLGCGFSDKPSRYPYRLADHIANLEQLLAALSVERCVLVVHDWGGAIGMGWAGRNPQRIAGTVVLNTAAFPSTRMPLRIALCRWPVIGSLLVRGVNGFARAAVIMAVTHPMRPEIVRGFLWPYNSWHNRIAIHRFVQDIPMDARHPSWNTLVAVESGLAQLRTKPMVLCWGGRDFCFDATFYQEWRSRFPEAEAHFFPEAGHYVLEDALVPIRSRIDGFLARTLR
ncbi:alpha/beta fold hydrolase [Desulfobulbus alkaliphilus]|uniref:alpha/beta fold hydrolase n=1 Tax=Desulfobulbus alkaliphilus TaxID=869814 RepID=UPI001963E8DE|nr:alpha/beta fold hydrolase [Desulfobulbus alkaliphilus]MBM9537257.1 alpha/beta fold hydrolase [Desulfobulbus alkaliphilus]